MAYQLWQSDPTTYAIRCQVSLWSETEGSTGVVLADNALLQPPLRGWSLRSPPRSHPAVEEGRTGYRRPSVALTPGS